MAEILDVGDMLGQAFEPKRKFRWLVAFEGIDGWTCKTAARPQITFDETVIDYGNTKRYLAGKASWQPITLTLYDPIVPSASQKMMEWVRLCYENVTGRMGYAATYKKASISLKLLDPIGAVCEEWELQGAWVQDANFGDLDYSVSDPVEVAITVRFDQAVLLY